MSLFPLKPTSAHVKKYYEALALSTKHGHTTEGNTRFAFEELLRRCLSPYGWHLVPEYAFKGTDKQPLRADGALVDDLTLVHGIWEAKDSDDDLTKEVGLKFKKGYPLTNILFQSPGHAVLYQDGIIKFNDAITDPEKLIEVLQLFCDHKQAHEVDWDVAVTKFAEKIPDLAKGVTTILEGEYKKNATFRENFESFAELCRQSINPDLTNDAIFKMLVQHLLTERIFRKVFNNQEFLSRNVIAAEIEKVIHSITVKHFSRDSFLKPLDRFYTAIEKAAESQTGYTEKQHFLNAVYEKFFQRFDTKQADTMGIVYTPQPIVDFMVRSVDEILQQEFGKTLSDKGVHILDPFTGTGNFITRVMQQIKRSAMPHKYAEELHCNEIMLLPYYIASMNIEHAYMEQVGQYSAFPGICLVDTFELAEAQQQTLFTTENTERVQRQKKSPIFIVLGNPPYNAWQKSEGENNQNRRYSTLDRRIKDTYVADSKATLRNSLSDPYVKAFRWASDRVGPSGIVAYVSNNSFLENLAFDGMRQHIAKEFTSAYFIDLGGNIRKNPKLSGTTNNVFGIQVGVCITILVRHRQAGQTPVAAQLNYVRMDENWRRGQKTDQLAQWGQTSSISWTEIPVTPKGQWVLGAGSSDAGSHLPIASKNKAEMTLFFAYSNGVKTNRDKWVINFNDEILLANVAIIAETYNSDRHKWFAKHRQPEELETILASDPKKSSYSRALKRSLVQNLEIAPSMDHVRRLLYRPFTSQSIYFDPLLIDETLGFPRIFPTQKSEAENIVFCIVAPASSSPFHVLAARNLVDLHITGDSQCFSFFRYSPEGTDRQENITDWALTEFRTHYADNEITKWDIFHATYAVLHHPEYRTRYAANLKRELPRIPFPPDLHAFSTAGNRLMELHIDYEKQPEYPLLQIEDPKAEVTFRVERMKLSKDKSELTYNEFLKLHGIPTTTYDYKLGNRSALEWVIDQYRVSTDARSGIVNDPNRADDPQYILRLIRQVITVSLETQRIIGSLPSLSLGD